MHVYNVLCTNVVPISALPISLGSWNRQLELQLSTLQMHSLLIVTRHESQSHIYPPHQMAIASYHMLACMSGANSIMHSSCSSLHYSTAKTNVLCHLLQPSTFSSNQTYPTHIRNFSGTRLIFYIESMHIYMYMYTYIDIMHICTCMYTHISLYIDISTVYTSDVCAHI